VPGSAACWTSDIRQLGCLKQWLAKSLLVASLKACPRLYSTGSTVGWYDYTCACAANNQMPCGTVVSAVLLRSQPCPEYWSNGTVDWGAGRVSQDGLYRVVRTPLVCRGAIQANVQQVAAAPGRAMLLTTLSSAVELHLAFRLTRNSWPYATQTELMCHVR
jgi:hypothetical protein